VESARTAGNALLARNKPAIAALGPGSGLESAVAIVDSLTSPLIDRAGAESDHSKSKLQI
jgi:hypothetical protein